MRQVGQLPRIKLLRSHVVNSVLDTITIGKWLINPLKVWQISNIWVGHLQNIMHEEIESVINSRNIWYVRTECHTKFAFAA